VNGGFHGVFREAILAEPAADNNVQMGKWAGKAIREASGMEPSRGSRVTQAKGRGSRGYGKGMAAVTGVMYNFA